MDTHSWTLDTEYLQSIILMLKVHRGKCRHVWFQQTGSLRSKLRHSEGKLFVHCILSFFFFFASAPFEVIDVQKWHTRRKMFAFTLDSSFGNWIATPPSLLHIHISPGCKEFLLVCVFPFSVAPWHFYLVFLFFWVFLIMLSYFRSRYYEGVL